MRLALGSSCWAVASASSRASSRPMRGMYCSSLSLSHSPYPTPPYPTPHERGPARPTAGNLSDGRYRAAGRDLPGGSWSRGFRPPMLRNKKTSMKAIGVWSFTAIYQLSSVAAAAGEKTAVKRTEDFTWLNRRPRLVPVGRATYTGCGKGCGLLSKLLSRLANDAVAILHRSPSAARATQVPEPRQPPRTPKVRCCKDEFHTSRHSGIEARRKKATQIVEQPCSLHWLANSPSRCLPVCR